MALCVERYLEKGRRYRVFDLGSRISPGQDATHRGLLRDYDCEYTGIDIRAGRNVDVVMKRPYSVPVKSNSADVVFAGQVFEHVPFFWASMLELARVMKPHGHLFLTVPSRGHVHSVYDCWRYYPDAMRALAAFAALELVEAFTDFPPMAAGRHDHARIERARYWGDTVGVFRKPARYPSARMAVVRRVGQMWANRVRDLESHPLPPAS
jgi:SAM-dependent methyltransferase